MVKPFFSVCIPATGRSKTITTALASLLNQNFEDFEIIVTMRRDEKTQNVVLNYLKQLKCASLTEKVLIQNIDKPVNGVEDWNDPLLFARGEYVLMLEGDDQFLRRHLHNLHRIIQGERKQLGLVAVSNQDTLRKRLGYMEPKASVRAILKLNDVPPPSEACFKRLNPDGLPYRFDNRFVYAPEIDLYLRIAQDNYGFFYSGERDVFRDRARSRKKGLGWKYFQDHFTVLNYYRGAIGFFGYWRVRLKLEARLFKNILRQNALQNDSFQNSIITRLFYRQLHRPITKRQCCKMCGAKLIAKYEDVSDVNFATTNEKFNWGECESCRSINLISLNNERKLSSYYLDYAPHKVQVVNRVLKRDPFTSYLALISSFLRLKKDSEPVRLIDLGCGGGAMLAVLRAAFPNMKLYGLDYNTVHATKNLKDCDVTLFTGSFENVPTDFHFDIIISSQFLEHLDNPDEYKSFVLENSKQNALIIFDVPNMDSLSYRIFGKNWVHLDTPRHRHLPTVSGVTQFFNQPVSYHFQYFGSYMAYVSSLCIVLFGTPHPSSPVAKFLRRVIQIALRFMPKSLLDDKYICAFELKRSEASLDD